MTEELTLKGGRGGTFPNPKGLGFTWKPLEKLIAKHQKVWSEERRLNQEYIALESEIAQLERREHTGLVESILTGDEAPDGSTVEEARRKLEKLGKRIQAYNEALAAVNREIEQTIARHREEWHEEVYQKLAEQAGEVEQAIGHLRSTQAGLEALSAFAQWVENPRKSFGFGEGPTNLDTFSGMVKTGEVYEALIRDAREKAVRPEERPQLEWQEAGARTSNVWR
jgi:DNA repair exonuclease SbcCD ATPase subunit